MEKTSLCQDDALKNGWYGKPRGLITFLESGSITKNEYLLFDYLFCFENNHLKINGTFHLTDLQISSTGLLSSKSIVLARRGLFAKGLIWYSKGRKTKATDYKILIPKYLYGKRKLKKTNNSLEKVLT